MKAIKYFLKAGEELIYPEGIRCHLCGEDLPRNSVSPFCKPCSETIHPVQGARCHRCGKPFDVTESAYIPYALKCAACQEQFSYVSIHRSFGHYEDGLKKILMDVKYKGLTHHLPYLGEILSTLVAETREFKSIDYIVPVPIHWTRRFSRGYNQSELLVAELAKRHSLHKPLNALKRQKYTVKLKKLDKEARKLALDNAIILSKNMLPVVKDKHVLLVDDIFTTGATLEACAKVLYESGCASVYAVTVAMGY